MAKAWAVQLSLGILGNQCHAGFKQGPESMVDAGPITTPCGTEEETEVCRLSVART